MEMLQRRHSKLTRLLNTNAFVTGKPNPPRQLLACAPSHSVTFHPSKPAFMTADIQFHFANSLCGWEGMGKIATETNPVYVCNGICLQRVPFFEQVENFQQNRHKIKDLPFWNRPGGQSSPANQVNVECRSSSIYIFMQYIYILCFST